MCDKEKSENLTFVLPEKYVFCKSKNAITRTKFKLSISTFDSKLK